MVWMQPAAGSQGRLRGGSGDLCISLCRGLYNFHTVKFTRNLETLLR